MKHAQDIAALLKVLHQSSQFHALVVESAPGWAKSSTVEAVLHDLSVDFISLGSYSTPLALYNSLAAAPERVFVLDDCAGLFGDPIAMSLLKSASWASAGTKGERRISWATSSERCETPSFLFSGKLILLANSIPRGREAEAFLSRALFYSISFAPNEIAQMLESAARAPEHFEDSAVALEVAKYLGGKTCTLLEPSRINLRTLKLGYELAKSHPLEWQVLLERLLPRAHPRQLLPELAGIGSVEEQAREFQRLTGLSRRTFFAYRRDLQVG